MTTMCDHHICIFGKSILQFCVASVTHSNWAKVFGSFFDFQLTQFSTMFLFQLLFSLFSRETKRKKQKKKSLVSDSMRENEQTFLIYLKCRNKSGRYFSKHFTKWWSFHPPLELDRATGDTWTVSLFLPSSSSTECKQKKRNLMSASHRSKNCVVVKKHFVFLWQNTVQRIHTHTHTERKPEANENVQFYS